MPIHIPHLRDKLALLYKSGRHPNITGHASLAAEMGVVTPQITNWLNGNAGMQESSLPDAKLQPFCRLFMLNVEDVLTDDLARFEFLIARPYSGWKRLFERATPYDEKNRFGLALKHRGLAYQPDDDELKGEHFQLGDPFRLEVVGPPGWQVIVLVRDPNTVTCWCPSPYFPDYVFAADGCFSIPGNDKPALSVTEPLGQHWLLTVYTEKPLPPLIYQELYDDLPINREHAINYLEQALNHKDVGQWLALRKAFYVTR
ncbi:MAG: hypothetical protein NTV43_03025 [Methylococcales bacterium]|nr:hypothetical protein [Methylococcales bacterium]